MMMRFFCPVCVKNVITFSCLVILHIKYVFFLIWKHGESESFEMFTEYICPDLYQIVQTLKKKNCLIMSIHISGDPLKITIPTSQLKLYNGYRRFT
jgi:hypothetical protein